MPWSLVFARLDVSSPWIAMLLLAAAMVANGAVVLAVGWLFGAMKRARDLT